MATIEKGLRQIRRASLATTSAMQAQVEKGKLRTESMLTIASETSNDAQKTPTDSSSPRRQTPSREEQWVSVQAKLVAAFERDLEVQELIDACDDVRTLVRTYIGSSMYEVYKEHTLVKGMSKLRLTVKKDTLQKSLEAAWKRLYLHILPAVQLMLRRVVTSDLSVRERTLVAFRDYVVLECGLEEEMEMVAAVNNPSIRQMLLVLQSVMECYPPNKQFLRIESMLGQLLPSYLGYLGLYERSAIPVILANRQQKKLIKRASSESRVAPPVANCGPNRGLKQLRQRSTPSNLSQLTHVMCLTPVAEQRHRQDASSSPTGRKHRSEELDEQPTPDESAHETESCSEQDT